MFAVIRIILEVFVLCFVATDIFINGKVWIGRIKIGRYKEYEKWYADICRIGKKWMVHMPITKKTSQSRLILIDILNGNYKNNNIQSWQSGGLYLGLTEHEKDQQVVQSYQQIFLGQDGRWIKKPEEVDYALLAYAILRKADDTEHLKEAMDQIYQLILERIQEKDGCVCYRKHVPDIRFVDTIGFICPFLCLYGKIYHVQEAIALSWHQIETYTEKGVLQGTSMLAHCYRSSDCMPMGMYGWGRGIGWFLLGILDAYIELEDSDPEKKRLEKIVMKAADEMYVYQNKEGGFYDNFLTKTRVDSSITAIAGYFYGECYRMFQQQVYRKVSEDCKKFLMNSTRRNGMIDFSQGDTKGMGIYASEFDIMPFTQGIAIRIRK